MSWLIRSGVEIRKREAASTAAVSVITWCSRALTRASRSDRDCVRSSPTGWLIDMSSSPELPEFPHRFPLTPVTLYDRPVQEG